MRHYVNILSIYNKWNISESLTGIFLNIHHVDIYFKGAKLTWFNSPENKDRSMIKKKTTKQKKIWYLQILSELFFVELTRNFSQYNKKNNKSKKRSFSLFTLNIYDYVLVFIYFFFLQNMDSFKSFINLKNNCLKKTKLLWKQPLIV